LPHVIANVWEANCASEDDEKRTMQALIYFAAENVGLKPLQRERQIRLRHNVGPDIDYAVVWQPRLALC
jgi:hypothetical protein